MQIQYLDIFATGKGKYICGIYIKIKYNFFLYVSPSHCPAAVLWWRCCSVCFLVPLADYIFTRLFELLCGVN